MRSVRGLYGQRTNVTMGARRVLGGVKHGIKFLGRANNFKLKKKMDYETKK
jgi:hypothetical protein